MCVREQRHAAADSVPLFWRLGGWQTAFEAENGVFKLQEILLPLQPLALADALHSSGQNLNLYGQVLHLLLELLEVVPVLLRFVGEQEKPLDVFKELLQHGQ